jgi:hypothetical protein
MPIAAIATNHTHNNGAKKNLTFPVPSPWRQKRIRSNAIVISIILSVQKNTNTRVSGSKVNIHNIYPHPIKESNRKPCETEGNATLSPFMADITANKQKR